MYDYQSEATKFLNDYIEKNPQEAEQRLKNRSLLWEAKVSAKEQAGYDAAKLPKKPYAYQPD
ncbi:MAG: DUF3460 family protein [Neisseria sp.]|nr:DUF3460 family protein [Neisseria sp.]